MKKHLLSLTIALSLFLMIGVAAVAQTTREMTVNIPFSFYVGKTELPAGVYTFYRTGANSGGGFLLRGANGQSKVVFNAQQSQSAGAITDSKLEFRTYDNKRFLASVWTAGNNIGHELQRTKLDANWPKKPQTVWQKKALNQKL